MSKYLSIFTASISHFSFTTQINPETAPTHSNTSLNISALVFTGEHFSSFLRFYDIELPWVSLALSSLTSLSLDILRFTPRPLILTLYSFLRHSHWYPWIHLPLRCVWLSSSHLYPRTNKLCYLKLLIAVTNTLEKQFKEGKVYFGSCFQRC
jgi:hypothetical protein